MGHIKQFFFEHPTRLFHAREIARILDIPKSTVSYKLKELLSKKIIKETHDIFKGFIANSSNATYTIEKKKHALDQINASGIIDYLEDNFHPRCIILFGSFAKGEYDHNSDVDIFVQASDAMIDLSKFEKKLDHKIQLLFGADLKKMSPEIANNIINGVKLSGFLKIF